MYLRGFMSGVEAKRRTLGLPLAPVGAGAEGTAGVAASLERAAQDRALADGRTLCNEEQAKRRQPPLERFDAIAADAASGRFPKGADVFLTKYEGLFFVAPAQDGFMCRMRIPGGILSSHQLRGIAELAERCAGGYAHVTTRNNLQLREIPADQPVEILWGLNELGIFPRGSGADNVRNVTGSPTAGIDADELLDTRPHARALNHYLLRHPELTGLPRKFNIAFDGGGAIPVLEGTNDVALTAVRVGDEILYRLRLGGITGHRDFARPTGVVVAPAEANAVCGAILRVFIAHGDRADRKRARLKYLLDAWGFDRFLGEVERELGRALRRVDEAAMSVPRRQDRLGHLGVHRQKQPGLNYLGVVLPVGRMEAAQMRDLAAVAERWGSSTLRLTVWQNLLISDVPDADVTDAVAAIEAAGLAVAAGPLRAGVIACTGSWACRFGNAETKSFADRLVGWLEARVAVDRPVNIHVTGCHNSCAQHYIGDIGLIGARVERPDDETVDGFDVHVGGGAGPDEAIGRRVWSAVASDEVPARVLALLRSWMCGRRPDEGFQAWSARLSEAQLAQLGVAEEEMAA